MKAHLGARRGRWSTPSPGRFIPEKETQFSLYTRLVGPGSVWTDAVNVAPTDFDAQTVQTVARRYTNWAIRAHI
jgi:hypothetical protein